MSLALSLSLPGGLFFSRVNRKRVLEDLGPRDREQTISICLCFTIADRSGHLKSKLASLLPDVLSLFEGAAALVTKETHPEIVTILDGLDVEMARAASDFHHIGMHRRRSVELGLQMSTSDHFLYLDIDHLLRWFENERDELEAILSRLPRADLTVIGRGSEAFASLPARLSSTESIVNRIYGLVTGNEWDLLMAARGISRGAAELIVNTSTVDHIGNDLDWPLLCRSQGMSLLYETANGLTYKTNEDYANGMADSQDSDPQAWAERIEIAAL